MSNTIIETKTIEPAGTEYPDLRMTDTRLVYGFLDAGKTTYIRENVMNDVFWKYGSTLIICFEEGEEGFDPESLAKKNTSVVYYEGGDVTGFCLDCIETYRPDRIYIEMNAMMANLTEALPRCMKRTFAITLIDWKTMPLYYINFMQMLKQMVSDSQQVVFRGCPSGELLAQYSQAFRLMNPKAIYLRQDPMGYHEKAFEMFLPYSLEDPEIKIDKEKFLPFWLDALDHPEHYDGKDLLFTDPVELKKSGTDGRWACGRVVMTCCMQDLQFMSFELEISPEHAADCLKDSHEDSHESSLSEGRMPEGSLTESSMTQGSLSEGWMTGNVKACVAADSYNRRKLRLRLKTMQRCAPPEELILDGRHS